QLKLPASYSGVRSIAIGLVLMLDQGLEDLEVFMVTAGGKLILEGLIAGGDSATGC
ncbi:MAG: hypothetical protein EZS28_031171, partial [Streblomastix strix]